MVLVAARLPQAAAIAVFKEIFQQLHQARSAELWEILETISRRVPSELIEEVWALALSSQNPPFSLLRLLVSRTPPSDQPQRWLQLIAHSRNWPKQVDRWEWISHLSRAVPSDQHPTVIARLEEVRVAEAKQVFEAFKRAERSWARSPAANTRLSSPRPAPPFFEPTAKMLASPPAARDDLTDISSEERISVLRQMSRRFGEALEADEDDSERVINLGFSEFSEQKKELLPQSPLQPSTEYLFWCEVGARQEQSITDVTTPLPTEHLPETAILTVAIFSFEGELELTSKLDTGKFKLWPNGHTTVEQHPTDFRLHSAPARLFFKIKTPARTGIYQLRCNLYYQTTLLQSWLVRAEVTESPDPKVDALRATQDFVYSHVLEPNFLAQLPSPGLTLMLNGNESASHLFIFGDDIKEGLSFTTSQLKGLVDQARDQLALASWGGPRPWDETQHQYLYDKGLDLEQLRRDLVRFAITGWRIFTVLTGRFPSDKREALRKLLTQPDSLQLALKESSQALVPLALVYDYAFDTNKHPTDKFKLCPDFQQAIQNNSPIEKLECFLSGCPYQHLEDTICPSGFWGFRHELGVTLSMPHLREKAPTFIPYGTPVQVAVGLSTDARFILRDTHLKTLRDHLTIAQWDTRDTRTTVLELLKSSQPHLVYFYCHGGLSIYNEPYIKVGAPNELGITRDNLLGNSIAWKQSRPLVFINGCHTAAVEPEVALDLVTGFIEDAYASGVLGTEITVFEPTASAFAEHCFQRLFEGFTVGRAVRDARRALLQKGNPLGLVYIPFVLPGLRFQPSPMAAGVTQKVPTPVVP